MPYYFQRISNGVCGFSAPRLVWGSPTHSKFKPTKVMLCIALAESSSHIGVNFQIWIKSSLPTCKSTTDLVGRHGKGCVRRARKDFISVLSEPLGKDRVSPAGISLRGLLFKKIHLLAFRVFHTIIGTHINILIATKSRTTFTI